MGQYEKISLDVFGLQLQEPMAFVTNYCLAIACLIFYQKLAGNSEHRSNFYWRLFFVGMGLSTALGGLAHLFHHYLPFEVRVSSWAFSGLGIAAAEMAALQHPIVSDRLRNALSKFTLIRLTIYILSIYMIQEFTIAKLNSTIGLMGITVPIYLIAYFRSRNIAPLKIVIGICCLLIPAAIHGLGISLHRWLNQDDLSHLIMIYCFYMMFTGAKDINKATLQNIPVN